MFNFLLTALPRPYQASQQPATAPQPPKTQETFSLSLISSGEDENGKPKGHDQGGLNRKIEKVGVIHNVSSVAHILSVRLIDPDDIAKGNEIKQDQQHICIIDDPLGQTQSTASSNHNSHLKLVFCFVRF